MSRRYQPDGTLLMTALVGRIDVLEETARQTSKDVAAVGRGLTDITTQLRQLNNTSSPTTPTKPKGTAPDEPEQQLDWFMVDDPNWGVEILTQLAKFVEHILSHYGFQLAPACWSLHPTVVADLLALMFEREAAYTGTDPTPVSEWLTRWLPAAHERVTRALADCVAERGHRHAGRTYDLTGFDPYSVPGWWATDRQTDPTKAFGLTPI